MHKVKSTAQDRILRTYVVKQYTQQCGKVILDKCDCNPRLAHATNVTLVEESLYRTIRVMY